MTLPLVFFSVLSQMAVGMAFVLWLVTLVPAWKNESMPAPGNWLVVLMVSLGALIARAFNQPSLATAWQNLQESGVNGLSSETQGFIIFTLFVFLLVRPTTKNFAVGAAFVGVATVLIAAWNTPAAFVYSTALSAEANMADSALVPVSSAYKDILISLMYLTTAVSLGAAHCLRLLSANAQKPLKGALAGALVLGFALQGVLAYVLAAVGLLAPFSLPATPGFWTGLSIAYMLPLALLALCARRKVGLPSIFPWIVLFGATLCRAQLFL